MNPETKSFHRFNVGVWNDETIWQPVKREVKTWLKRSR